MNDSATLLSLKDDLRHYVHPEKARFLPRFFKTGLGEYAEGDLFLGVVVPDIRKVFKAYKYLNWDDLKALLQSPYHEERFLALIIMKFQYLKGDDAVKEKIYTYYINHIAFVNNWDLVDISAPDIVGQHLYKKNTDILFQLGKSSLLWERRVSIMATFYMIKKGEFQLTFDLADLLLMDEHDLIHKAVGWMLREIGKKNFLQEKSYLDKKYKYMPRTMLRYAIEKFPEELRQDYLKSRI